MDAQTVNAIEKEDRFVTTGFMVARVDEKGRYCGWHTAPSLEAATTWADYMEANNPGQEFLAFTCRWARDFIRGA